MKAFKKELLEKAVRAFRKKHAQDKDYLAFCEKEAYWLDDYALFHAGKKAYARAAWTDWPDPVKYRAPDALRELAAQQADEIELDRFKQYIFHLQWNRLHDYARKKGIEILGDMPIFIAQDSADAWAHQHLFDRVIVDGTVFIWEQTLCSELTDLLVRVTNVELTVRTKRKDTVSALGDKLF